TDHFACGSTSAVGTYHRPVSPLKVVVAGRVSVAGGGVEGGCEGEAGVCAAAAAAQTAHALASAAIRIVVVIGGRRSERADLQIWYGSGVPQVNQLFAQFVTDLRVFVDAFGTDDPRDHDAEDVEAEHRGGKDRLRHHVAGRRDDRGDDEDDE